MKKSKNYFAQKREIRQLSLDTLQKINNIATILSDLSDVAANIVNDFNTDDIKTFMTDINKLISSPELTTDYFKQVNANAHIERMVNQNK